MLTLHKLFLNDGAPSSFDEVIAPTDEQRRKLIAAKNAIRDHLRRDPGRNGRCARYGSHDKPPLSYPGIVGV